MIFNPGVLFCDFSGNCHRLIPRSIIINANLKMGISLVQYATNRLLQQFGTAVSRDDCRNQRRWEDGVRVFFTQGAKTLYLMQPLILPIRLPSMAIIGAKSSLLRIRKRRLSKLYIQ